jgi:hypothetical protein
MPQPHWKYRILHWEAFSIPEQTGTSISTLALLFGGRGGGERATWHITRSWFLTSQMRLDFLHKSIATG